MKDLAALDPEARRLRGAALNVLKTEVLAVLEARKAALADAELDARLASERIDITLPVRARSARDASTRSARRSTRSSRSSARWASPSRRGRTSRTTGPTSALNIPPEHPARQEMDTFYLPGERDGRRLVLRTHTSPVQVRTMLAQQPPVRVIAPGRTYRSDYDATHSPMFHQVEGLVIDESTHMGHLKGCLIEFLRAYFALDDLPVRFRPSYFPFTEPSAEVDIGCTRTGGTLRIGDGDDWLEILGCGMVHPKVLENCGLDPARWQGFAFGMGLERIGMLKYGIPDLRTFFESDLRWLRHYGFAALDQPSLVAGS